MLGIFNDLGIKSLCNAEADKHTQLAIASLNKLNASPDKIKTLKNFALELLNRQT